MPISIAPTRTRTVAAARLTSAYTASIGLLVVPLLGVVRPMTDMLGFLPSAFGVWVATTFVLLAVARRAGFTALWLLTLLAWLWPSGRFAPDTLEMGASFALWSLLAAPLYAITVVGFGEARSRSAMRRGAWIAAIAGWAALLAVSAHFLFGFGPMGCVGGYQTTGLRALDSIVETAWLAVPPLVALDAIRRVWRGRRIEASLE